MRAPAERGLQHAADHRRADRRERHDGAHQRELAPRARAGIKVAHDRAREHDRARRAERLEGARRQQRLDRGRERAGERGRAVDRERRAQHRNAAEAIRQRAVDDLSDRVGDHVERERELHRRGRGAEQPPDLGKRRQVHVDRDRPERGQQREQGGQREGVGAEHGAGRARFIGFAPPCRASAAIRRPSAGSLAEGTVLN